MKQRKYNHQINKNKNFFQSLYHALAGIKDLIVDERNFRIHLVLAVIYIIIGFILRFSVMNWICLLFALGLVFITEAINTVAENITDLLVGHHYNKTAKVIKDVAAGGVLIASTLTLIIFLLVCLDAFLHL